MTSPEPRIDAPPVDGKLIRVIYQRLGPLWGHQLSVHDQATGIDQPLAVSVEGAQQDPWPTSPPLQAWQMSEDRQGRPVFLATGAAGRSHWSLAVSVLEPAALLFDVACRTNEAPQLLGSTYRLDPAWIARPTPDGVQLVAPSWLCRLEGIPRGGRPTRVTESGGQVQMAPAVEPAAAATATFQWAYQVRIEPT